MAASQKIDSTLIIKIKEDYIKNGLSQRQLADKWGVSRPTLQRYCAREGWVALREKAERDAEARLNQTILAESATDSVMGATGIYQLAYSIVSQLSGLTSSYTLLELNRKGIKPREITGALRDLKDILGVKSEVDAEEQRARIDALRARAEADKTEPITITMGEDAKAYSE